jgi:carboxymethylenebutenolidase
MNEETVEIRTPDGIAEALLFRHERGKAPGVIHLTDLAGIRPAQREMAQRLAGEGFTVLMPNLFWRTGKPPFFTQPMTFADPEVRRRLGELTAPLTPEAVERDGAAYVDFLAAHPSVVDGPLGVAGYCYSGALALRIAAARPELVGAAASFHGGGLFTDAPTSPHLVLPRIEARLYFAHAVQDKSMPADAIAKLGRALEAWGGAYESETYDGAFHGWTTPDSPVYSASPAERAFRKLKALLTGSDRRPRE